MTHDDSSQLQKEKDALAAKVNGGAATVGAGACGRLTSGQAVASKIPPGHTEFTWAGKIDEKIPPGHSAYTWMGGVAPAAAAGCCGGAAGPVKVVRKGTWNRTPIKTLLFAPKGGEEFVDETVTVAGWTKTVRIQGGGHFAFVEINDGSCFSNMQAVVQEDCPGWEALTKNAYTGVSISVDGVVVKSPGTNQKIELKAVKVDIVGPCDPTVYPLAKGRQTVEFLRGVAHLRPRTNTIGSMARVRNVLAMAVHNFFQSEGAFYVHSPILTAADCEGAGEQFNVSTLPHPAPSNAAGGKDYSKDFFGREVFLSVSGQLEAEVYACSLSSVYTFGPTFRAENSHTTRHLAEFWMIEPEFAFCDLRDDIDYAVRFIKFCVNSVLQQCQDELGFFEKWVAQGLKKNLQEIVDKDFHIVTYTQAIEDCQAAVGKTWEFPPKWGDDLASEHERYLTEEKYSGPCVVINWPKSIKAFYMRLNEDNKTVAAMDVLLPRVGEIIGGSQREEREEVLKAR